MQKLSMEIGSHLYVAKITNISKNLDITDYIDNCNITLPKTSEISSMDASFTLEEKLIDTGNEVRIDIMDEVGNLLYTLQGMATLEKRNKSYTGKETFDYSIKDSYEKLFDKVVPETMIFFDLYFCNTNDKYNSLLHIVAKKLGFRDDELDFKDISLENGRLMRVPFVIFEQDERWVDILQRFIKATDSILYIKAKKLFVRPCNFTVNKTLKLDRTNIINNIEERLKSTSYNGIRVTYDRFVKLENQVVFNLSQKIIVNENTLVGSNVQAMRITYTTSSVSNPTLTNATAYYFTREDDVSSKVDVNLVKGTHYTVEEWKETQAIVKFFNPYQYKLYIDNFEIKGLPLVKFEDNEAIIKQPNVLEKSQENFISIPKNREVQTEKIAKHIALSEYKAQILNNRAFNFSTYFLKDIELGEVYSLVLEDINTIVRVTNIQISLRPAQFQMRIDAECVENKGDYLYSSVLSGRSNTTFVDLKPLEDKITENNSNIKLVSKDIRSKLFKQTFQPLENVKENDIWLNPNTNIWKKFYNGVWNSISEEEILPSMKMYNSLDKNIIKLQGTNDKVGAYLLNDGEKFGSLNGELAHVTFDKLGQFEAINPNNKIALNIKDPADPTIVTSQILLGVTDITDESLKDVIFQVGDKATGNYISFKRGKMTQKVNGQDLKTIADNVTNVSSNLNNLSNKVTNDLNDVSSNVGNLSNTIDTVSNRVTNLTSNVTQVADHINTVKGALENGDFIITANTVFDGAARFVSRGTNEVITIDQGSIDFYRNGLRLTRIKNIRYGSISTDSNGSGIVNFEGFKQPMLVLPSIKSANFGRNMASIFCYTENIKDCMYKFYIGGTNEQYREPKPIKVIGTEWTSANALQSTLLGITGKCKEEARTYKLQNRTKDYWERPLWNKGTNKVLTVPKFNVKVIRLDNEVETVLHSQDYTMRYHFKGAYNHDGWHGYTTAYYETYAIDFSKTFNILKNYTSRTNVKFKLIITILEANLTVNQYFHGYDFDDSKYYSAKFEGVLKTITMNDFEGLSITGSSETSTLSSATGNGEVQYIAMEID